MLENVAAPFPPPPPPGEVVTSIKKILDPPPVCTAILIEFLNRIPQTEPVISRAHSIRELSQKMNHSNYSRNVLVFLTFCKNFKGRQIIILWSLYSVVFHVLTLKLSFQTSLSVVPKLLVSLRSAEKCENFRKTSTSQRLGQHLSERIFILYILLDLQGK